MRFEKSPTMALLNAGTASLPEADDSTSANRAMQARNPRGVVQ